MASTWGTSWGTSWGVSWDRVAAVVEVAQGGGWLSEEQVKDYERSRKRKRAAVEDLEETVQKAWDALHGKVPEKVLPQAVSEAPQVLVRQAKEISRVLVARKAQKEATATELALLKEIKRLSDRVVKEIYRQQQEEEAIVMLLVA